MKKQNEIIKNLIKYGYTKEDAITIINDLENKINKQNKSSKQKKNRSEEKTYINYLNSREWKIKVQEFKKSKYYQGQCYICNNKENLQIHHKTYKNVYNEKVQDLVCLCDKCHTLVHKILNKKISGFTLANCHVKVKHIYK